MKRKLSDLELAKKYRIDVECIEDARETYNQDGNDTPEEFESWLAARIKILRSHGEEL